MTNKRRETENDSDEEIIRDLERAIEEGRELENVVPVRSTTSVGNRRAVFSVKLGQDELATISSAADLRGSSVGEFIRAAALEAAGVELAQAAGKATLVEMKAHVDALSRSIRRQIDSESRERIAQ